VFNEYDKDNLLKDLAEQNEHLKTSKGTHFEIKKIIKSKYNDTSNYIVETESKMRRLLVHQGKVFLGYQRIRVEDANPLLQCFHCLGFSHSANRCIKKENTKPKCPHCAGDHMYRECTKKAPPSCVNCLQQNEKSDKKNSSNHQANDKNCPIYRRMLQFAQQKVEY
jgi:hypothetical protein